MTPLAFYAWTYDSAGRVDTFNSADGLVDYDYDPLGQLTSADYQYLTDEAYTYDAAGNRTLTGYVTDEYNRLQSDGFYTFEYDAEGNRTKRIEIATGEYTVYVWDHANRLTRVAEYDEDDELQSAVDYLYDALGRRIGKEFDDDGVGTIDRAEVYIWDDANIVLEFEDMDGEGAAEDWQLSARNLWGPAVDQLLAREAVGEVYWPLADRINSVRDIAVYDAASEETAIAEHLTYDAFGNITSGNAGSFRYTYTSQEFDSETGLYYYNARYYDAFVGRFLSEDPIGFAAGDSHIYRYVFNSSTNATDPTGKAILQHWTDIEGALGILTDGKYQSPRGFLNLSDAVESAEMIGVKESRRQLMTHRLLFDVPVDGAISVDKEITRLAIEARRQIRAEFPNSPDSSTLQRKITERKYDLLDDWMRAHFEETGQAVFRRKIGTKYVYYVHESLQSSVRVVAAEGSDDVAKMFAARAMGRTSILLGGRRLALASGALRFGAKVALPLAIAEAFFGNASTAYAAEPNYYDFESDWKSVVDGYTAFQGHSPSAEDLDAYRNNIVPFEVRRENVVQTRVVGIGATFLRFNAGMDITGILDYTFRYVTEDYTSGELFSHREITYGTDEVPWTLRTSTAYHLDGAVVDMQSSTSGSIETTTYTILRFIPLSDPAVGDQE